VFSFRPTTLNAGGMDGIKKPFVLPALILYLESEQGDFSRAVFLKSLPTVSVGSTVRDCIFKMVQFLFWLREEMEFAIRNFCIRNCNMIVL
jgi:hypothetical protein